MTHTGTHTGYGWLPWWLDCWAYCQWVCWALAIFVLLCSIFGLLASRRMRKRWRLISNINSLTGLLVMVVAVAACLWHVHQILSEVQGRADGAARNAMLMLIPDDVARYISVAVILSGLNQLVAVALRRRWKEPQPTPSRDGVPPAHEE